jgi:clan AA aspartic protease
MTPTTQLQVGGSRGEAEVTAIVDTGFDGHVCLPTLLAVGLGLELSGQNEVELADGTRKLTLVFAGTVRFLEHERDVAVYLTESDEALIGTRLMSDCRLTIDFTTGKVQLARNLDVS